MEDNLKETPHNLGDVVTFKAGGPSMIVIKTVDNNSGYPVVKCEWFDVNDHLMKDVFYQYQLIKKEIV